MTIKDIADGKCHNAEPGTFNHECGKPATWIGIKDDGQECGFCDDCKERGCEHHAYVRWIRHSRLATPAELAVAYTIERIRRDPRIAYYFGDTECLAKLARVHAATTGTDPETYHRELNASLRTEAPARVYDLVATLKAVDHTLSAHGHIDADTTLHEEVCAAIAKAEAQS